MAHRWEKEANGQTALVFDGWEQGIGPSPEKGHGFLTGVALEIEGEIASSWPLTSGTQSGATLSNNPTYGCVDYSVPAGTGNGTYTYYQLDAGGHAWGSTGDGTWHSLGNTTTSAGATVQGIVVWHNYIFVFRNDSIDYAATNAPTVWTDAWQSITGTTYHPAIVAQSNDVIYFCNGNKIGSIAWNGGSAFNPATSSTYTFNASALLLPFDEMSTSLAILGTNLMVGGFSNRIYPWDRISSTYGAPLLLPETFVWRMVNANNFLYIFMGQGLSRGRVYVTSGSAISEFFKMPDSLSNTVDPYWLWGDAIWWRNYLIFGALAYKNSGDTVLANPSPPSIWAVKLGLSLLGSTDQRFFGISELAFDKTIAAVLLPVVGNTAKGGWDLFVGVADKSSTNYDFQGPTSGSSAIGTEIETDIASVGTSIVPKTFKQIEFKLSTPMTSGEFITVYTRTNLSDSWVQQGSLANDTTSISPTAPFSLSTEKL
ncbi:MAG: hypothetical protein KGL39_30230, partial [Patescibacteria group bacterium]|nr:hypothetical protein [Patescibacteria group bacterium]